MAINVELKNEEKTVEKIDFPVLMKSIGTGYIVLFTSWHEGVIIVDINEIQRIGFTSSCFSQCTDGSVWEKYTGEITLKNK